MPTRPWIPTAGCSCWRCRPGSRSLRTLRVSLAAVLLSLAVLYAAIGCATTGTQPQPAPAPQLHALDVQVADVAGPLVPGAVVTIQDNQNAGRTATTGADGRALLTGLIVPSGQTVCAEKAGYQRGCVGVTLTTSTHVAIRMAKSGAGPVDPGTGVVTPPSGQVRAATHSLRDDRGPRLYWGTSLFWALWGELHDTARLDANLLTASQAGADYIRVFAQVGGASWANRAVDPRDPGWQAAIRSLTDKAYDRYGLRVQWTLFAWPKNLTQAQRMAALSSYLAAIDGRHHKVWATEVSNEGDENGPSPADARALASRLRTSFPGLIAITAPTGDSCLKQAPWYRDSVASLITLHFQRSTSGEGKLWRPVRQPWRESTFKCDGQTGAYSDNEGIGPKSSGAEDDDPLRLVMRAVVGWIGGVGAYVYHTDAGIRGGGAAGREPTSALDRSRRANLSEVGKFTETTAGLNKARSLLPPDVPNWARGTSNPPMFGVDFMSGPTCEKNKNCSIDRVYCAWRASEFVCAAFNIYKNTVLTAKRALSVKALHPLSGAVLHDVTLATGGTLTLAGAPGGTAVILRGVFR